MESQIAALRRNSFQFLDTDVDENKEPLPSKEFEFQSNSLDGRGSLLQAFSG